MLGPRINAGGRVGKCSHGAITAAKGAPRPRIIGPTNREAAFDILKARRHHRHSRSPPRLLASPRQRGAGRQTKSRR